MNIVYYPAFAAVPAPGAVVVAPPPGALSAPPNGAWPKTAAPTTYKHSLSAAQLAMAVLKDIDPVGAPPLLNSGWLISMFSSMYPTTWVSGSDMMIAESGFSKVPGNWLKVFSELVGVGVSLAIAEYVEDFPYCLSMQFCKAGGAVVVGGRTAAWPLEYPKSVLSSWHVDKAPVGAGAAQIALMPDYVIARQVPGGGFQFATLESKARDAPVDGGNYGNLQEFISQAQNAVIALKPGLAAPLPPLPVLSRRILSLVAVRPKLKKASSRVLRCRWVNHRLADGEDAPASYHDGLRFVAASTAVHLHNAGFGRMAEVLARSLQGGVADALRSEQLDPLLKSEEPLDYGMREFARGWLTASAEAPRVGDVVMPRSELGHLVRLAKVVAAGTAQDERNFARNLWQRREIRQGGPRLIEERELRVELCGSGFGLIVGDGAEGRPQSNSYPA